MYSFLQFIFFIGKVVKFYIQTFNYHQNLSNRLNLSAVRDVFYNYMKKLHKNNTKLQTYQFYPQEFLTL